MAGPLPLTTAPVASNGPPSDPSMLAQTPAVRLHDLGKRYERVLVPLGSLRDHLSEMVGNWGRTWRQPAPIWALRGLTLDIGRGQVVGLIGRNGSGKTTLMKILAQVVAPTEGMAEIYGRVGALLEVGTGFHPELSGRENIELAGTIMGMSRVEIHDLAGDIIAFAGVDDFLDMPVKRYSTGMFMRLAFSVSIHLPGEILLVDEILAVGDLEFQLKCYDRIDRATRDGRTVIFVSHATEVVRDLCESAFVLEGGRLAYQGSSSDAAQFYLEEILGRLAAESEHSTAAVRDTVVR